MAIHLIKYIAFITVLAILSPRTALAVDCAKAISMCDKAICSDPRLIANDQHVTASYALFYDRLDKKQQTALRQVQSEWIKKVESCDIGRTGDNGETVALDELYAYLSPFLLLRAREFGGVEYAKNYYNGYSKNAPVVHFDKWLSDIPLAKNPDELREQIRKLQPGFEFVMDPANMDPVAHDDSTMLGNPHFAFTPPRAGLHVDVRSLGTSKTRKLISMYLHGPDEWEYEEWFWMGVVDIRKGKMHLIASFQDADSVCNSNHDRLYDVVNTNLPIKLVRHHIASCGSDIAVIKINSTCFLGDDNLLCLSDEPIADYE